MYINSLPHIVDKKYQNYIERETSFKGGQLKITGVTAAASAAISAIAIGLINIQRALKKERFAENIDIKELFTPTEEYQQTILDKINGIEGDDSSFPEALKQKMIDAIRNNNFDLKGVYNEYYSTLNLCETLEDVKKIYPEMRFPDIPETQHEQRMQSADSAVFYCSKPTYSYYFRGWPIPFHIQMRHYQKPEDLDKTLDIIQNKTSVKNPDLIKKTADTVKTDGNLSELIESLYSIYDENTAQFLSEERIIGLLKTMSMCKSQSKNIVEFYKLLISAETKQKNLISGLTSAPGNYFAGMLGDLKTSDDVKKVFEITEKWGSDVYEYIISNPQDCIKLYNLSENKAPFYDISRVFSQKNVKGIIAELLKNPNAKNILDNYKSYTGESSINGLGIQCMIEDLGLSDTEAGKKALESMLPKSKRISDKKALSRRFEGQNYDKAIIDALKKMYIDLVPISNVKIQISEDDWCLASSFAKFRGENPWSTPNKEVIKTIKESDNMQKSFAELYSYLRKLNAKDYRVLAEIPAKRIYWEDFKENTSGEWFTIRLIKDRQYNEKSLYNQENLVESYLYNLYKESRVFPEKRYSTNPLARAGSYPFLTKYSKQLLDETYRNIYNDRHNEKWRHFTGGEYSPVDYSEQEDFKKFCQLHNFDKQAIGESLLKIEKSYHRKFYGMYHSKEGRVEMFKDSINDALKLIYGKLELFGKIQAKAQTATIKDAQALLDELDEDKPNDIIDEEKLNRFKFIVQNMMRNNELKTRCQSCISGDFTDKVYFDYIYDVVQNSITKDKEGNEILNEIKVLVILNLHDKFIENSNGDLSEEEFISKELAEYKFENGGYDYEKYYNDKKSELNFYSLIGRLENNNEGEMANYITNFIINNSKLSFAQANDLMSGYINLPEKTRKIVKQIVNQSDKCFTMAAFENIKDIMNMTESWHMDKAEIIVINDAGINKKVIITESAKYDLWDKYNGNYVNFGSELKKYYKAAKKYAAKSGDEGIKNLSDGSAELKLKGQNGGMRMYTRPVTPEDTEMYKLDENDKMPIKYIFCKYDKHLSKKGLNKN